MLKKSLLLYLASWALLILLNIPYRFLTLILRLLARNFSLPSSSLILITTLLEIPVYLFLVYWVNKKYFHLPTKTVILVQTIFLLTLALLLYLLFIVIISAFLGF
jgi:hypothetical protein